MTAMFFQVQLKTSKLKENKMLTEHSQIIHTAFTNAKYTIIRKKEVNKMKWVKDYDGILIDYEAAVSLMDNEIREELHNEWSDDKGGEQEFYNAYCEKHYEKYHEYFEI